MAQLVYIGDAVCAAGWHLAGAEVRTPAPAQAQATLQAVLAEHAGHPQALVLLSAALLPALDAALVQRAQSALQPLLLVLPDIVAGVAAPDLAARLRGQLGMEVA